MADHCVSGAFLCHGDSKFGDYIVMKVASDGTITQYRRPKVDDEQRKVL